MPAKDANLTTSKIVYLRLWSQAWCIKPAVGAEAGSFADKMGQTMFKGDTCRHS